VNETFCCYYKIADRNNLRKKGLILVYCFRACGEAEHHSRSAWWKKARFTIHNSLEGER
jgi:hypothetical protein